MRERSAPSVNFGTCHISETMGTRKLKIDDFFTHLDRAKYAFWYDICLLEVVRGAGGVPLV